MKIGSRLFLCVLFTGLSMAAFPENHCVAPDFGLGSLSFWNFQFFGGVKGFELVPGSESKALAYLGGLYYPDGWYYDANGSPIGSRGVNSRESLFGYWGLNGKIGLDIGLVYDESLAKNCLFSQLYLRSEHRWNVQNETSDAAIFDSDSPERRGLWESSIFANVRADFVELSVFNRTRQGWDSEFSAEWVPGLGINSAFGRGDYARFTGRFRGYLTILEDCDVSLYLADRVIADVLVGKIIPGHAQRAVGGFMQEPGTGGAMRGVAFWRYDSNLKLINNFDVRVIFPMLISYELAPELFAFFDAALVDGRDYRLASPGDGLYATGVGIVLHVVPVPSLGRFEIEIGNFVSYAFGERDWRFLNFMLGMRLF